MSHIDIVTLTYNSSHVFERFLNGLSNGGHEDFSLIVVDNNSYPEHREKMYSQLSSWAKNERRVLLLQQEQNHFFLPDYPIVDGYGKSMNIGLRRATGQYVVGMNPDCFGDVQPNWLADCLRYYTTFEPEIGVMGATLVVNDTIDHAGGEGLTTHIAQGRKWNPAEFGVPRRVEWNTGAFHFYSKRVLEDIGYMKSYPMASDRQTCWNAEHVGYKNYCCPVRLWHQQDKSSENLSRHRNNP